MTLSEYSYNECLTLAIPVRSTQSSIILSINCYKVALVLLSDACASFGTNLPDILHY